jgi:predicted P-loop ATPase
VRIKEFDIEGLTRDRDQLWAEARVRIMKGESIRMPQELWPIALRHQEARQEVDPWEPMFCTFLDDEARVRGDGRRRVTTEELYALLNIELARRDAASARRISQIMQRLGFERTKVYDREAGKTVAGYLEAEPSELGDGRPSEEAQREDEG